MPEINQAPQTQDIEKTFSNIINSFVSNGNYSAQEMATNNLVKMTLMSLQKGTHPCVNPHDFKTDVIPVPNMTVFDNTSNQHTGIRFPANTTVMLDIFSRQKNLSSRNFVTLDELKRMKLDKYVKYEDTVNIPMHGKFIDKNLAQNKAFGTSPSIRVVNVESLLKSKNNPRGALNEEMFKQYFPDFDKQKDMFNQYALKSVLQLKKNAENKEAFSTVTKQINIEKRNSHLPKMTEELFHMEYCRKTKQTYIPKFSRDEHIKDMVQLYKKSPNLLKDAVQQSGYISDRSLNQIFDKDMMARVDRSLVEEQKLNPQQQILEPEKRERTQTMVNNTLTKEKSKSLTMSAPRKR